MRTLIFNNGVYLKCGYSAVGHMEGMGPLKEYFDYVFQDDTLKEKSYEKAERHMLEDLINGLLNKSKLEPKNIDFFIAGDLLNQIVSSSYCARDFEFPFLGLYSACATMVESLILAGVLISSSLASNVICATCTHFSTAERQYRFPLELGNQRPPTSQWTITGGGASLMTKEKSKIRVASATIGKVIDFGIKDINNMGAAMAPPIVIIGP